MIEFNIDIADEIIQIICYNPFTKSIFKDYFTDEEANFTVFPKRVDKEKIRERFRAVLSGKDAEIVDRSHSFSEYHAIHLEMATKLIDRDVLLMHGSAVVADGSAYLFIAPSGTGKSTHTKHWLEALGERAFIINDDKPLIRMTDGDPLIYPTPWGIKEKPAQAEKAPLKAMILLERADFNRLTPMDESEMFAHLYKAALRGETPTEVIKIIELERRLMKQVGLFRMQCTDSIDAAKTAIKELKVEI